MNPHRANASVEETIASISQWFSHQFDELHRLGAELTDELDLTSDSYLTLTPAARRTMKVRAAKYLQRNTSLDGCGLIFSRSVLTSEMGHLEWWVREDESRYARYSFGVVPGADRYYDYEQDDWFISAFHEGKPAAIGPFIDYLGVEVYILTITIPATVNGVRVGAVGNDMKIDDLEHELLPIMMDCAHEIVLLSSRGNVLVSNTSKFLSGETIINPPTGYKFKEIVEPGVGLHVLVPKGTH